jgi:hypothetical protein
VEARIQVLDEVTSLRYWNIGRTPAVDGCSVYRLLDRDTALVARLSGFARERLRVPDWSSCPAGSLQRREEGWYVTDIERRGSGQLVVTAEVSEHGGHTETFILTHGYADRVRWRVAEVRMTAFWFE